jgi:hypothetical protein
MQGGQELVFTLRTVYFKGRNKRFNRNKFFVPFFAPRRSRLLLLLMLVENSVFLLRRRRTQVEKNHDDKRTYARI